MASQGEKVFFDAEAGEPQNRAEDPQDQLFGGRPRPRLGGDRLALRLEPGERFAVHLAIGGERQLGEEHPGSRQHMLRQPLAEEAAQLRRRSCLERDHGGQQSANGRFALSHSLGNRGHRPGLQVF